MFRLSRNSSAVKGENTLDTVLKLWKYLLVRSLVYLFCFASPLNPTCLFSQQAEAQETAGSLSGSVTDPSGALIPQATVSVRGSNGKAQTIHSDAEGNYSLSGLAPGRYTISASALGFASYRHDNVVLRSGQKLHLNISLQIEATNEQVTVSEEPEGLDASPGKGGGATVLKGSDLDALSEDRDELQTELQAIAGGDGESGNQFFIDGFSGGKLPPKETIREIRINQNPYSAQYDSLGWGRIEIFTKPGADKLHGEFGMSGNNSSFNTKSKFVTSQPPYYSYDLFGHLTGPINKKASYFVELWHSDNQNNSTIKALILDPNLNQTSLNQTVSTPSAQISFNPRLDWQAGKNNTVTFRYQLDQSSQDNAGIGQFSLPSQGYASNVTVQTWQIGDTQVFGPRVVDEIRFQYIRSRSHQASMNASPTIIVQGAFNGGGNNLGSIRDNNDKYEFQDYVSVAAGKHFVRFGGRLRLGRDANRSTANYNGEFIFPSLNAYQVTELGLKNGLSDSEIRTNGGGATQFNLTGGIPNIAVSLVDAGLYAEDDWKAAKNITVSYGLRFESQTQIADHADWAPRIGLSWGVGSKNGKGPSYVIRAGYGWFYQRFVSNSVLQAQRQNGLLQQEYVVTNPSFYPNLPDISGLAAKTNATTYRINLAIQSPLSMVSGIGVEHGLGKRGSISANYMYSRGIHQFLTRNINAPLPGTYDPNDPTSGVRPYGGNHNIYEYEAEGTGKRNRFFVNANLNAGKKFSFFGSYGFSFSKANAAGIGGFPSNQYDLNADWGRSSYDNRHHAFLGGSVQLPFGFHFNNFAFIQSSSPFNIVLGRDLNGDAQYNDRPTFANDLSRNSVVRTKWGVFDTDPIAGQKTIPINYGKGPSVFMLNASLRKSISFGPEMKAPGPPPPAAGKTEKPHVDRQYQLDIGAYSGNIINRVNLGQPVGTLTSQYFGQSTSLFSWSSSGSANRTVELYMHLRF